MDSQVVISFCTSHSSNNTGKDLRLRTLSNKCDWVPSLFEPFVTNSVVEDHAHDIANLGLGGIGEITRTSSLVMTTGNRAGFLALTTWPNQGR